ncbi:hypothetical protein V6N11_084028 [Hibiscus sabdariffa]|uniref:Uncharacterized protein n=2 Tax=Hibiscus sabdariffa TaxID=183260 RepID=A0ABR1ZHE4_9ROSI
MAELPWNCDVPSSLTNKMFEKGMISFFSFLIFWVFLLRLLIWGSFGFRLGKRCTDDGFSDEGIDDGEWVQLKGDWWLKKRRRISGGYGALGYDLEVSGVVEINGGNEGYGGCIE